MAKKTYAAVMKQLSNKKAQYEKGLAEAQRTGNQGGIADYNRRLAKLAAGMDQLFEAQEAAKVPQMKYGGNTDYKLGGMTMPKYDEGGITAENITTGQLINAIRQMVVSGNVADGYQLTEWGAANGILDPKKAQEYTTNFGLPRGARNTLSAAKFNADPSARAPFPEGLSEQVLTAASAPANFKLTKAERDFYNNNKSQSAFNKLSPADKQRYLDVEDRIRYGVANAENSDEPTESFPWWDSRNPANRKADMNQDRSFGWRGVGAGRSDAEETPTPLAPKDPMQRGGMLLDPFMLEMNEQVMAGAPREAAPAPAPATTTSTQGAQRTQPSAEAQRAIMDKFGDRLPGGGPGAWREAPLWNDAAGAPRINDIPVTDKRHPDYVDPNAPVDRTQSGYNIDFGAPTGRSKSADPKSRNSNFDGQALGMAIGGAAQLLPQLAAKRRMQEVEGPVDTPMQRMQMMNTDIQTGAAIQNIKQAQADTNAMLDRNFSNPAIANAMKRAAARETQAQLGNIAFNEAAKEAELRNQNMMRATDTLNANALIDAQNRQRQIDFRNDLRGALGQQDMLMGQTLGNIAMDFQNRAADEKRWNLYKHMFTQGILDRNDIDPLG